MFDTMNAVISISGTVIADAVEQDNVQPYVDVIQQLAAETDTLVIVTGAGPVKSYIDAVRHFDVPEARKDLIGIAATRMQASSLAAALGANTRIPETLEDVAEMSRIHDIIVLGGLLPGQSTDGVAAECAEIIDADRLVIATTVDGVYTADPDTDADADKIDELTYTELIDLVKDEETGAGTYALMDLTAAKLVQRSQIETVILTGKDPEVLAQALTDGHGGTVVSDT